MTENDRLAPDAEQPRRNIAAKAVVEILQQGGEPFRFADFDIIGLLDLREASVRRTVEFVRCRFTAIVSDSASFDNSVRFERCNIQRWRANYATFKGELRFVHSSARELIFHNAKFEKACSLHRGTFGRIVFSSIQADANVRVRRLTASSVTFAGGTVRGTCDIRRLQTRTLDLGGLRSGRLQAAFVRADEANLDNIEVKDQIGLEHASVKDELRMSSVEVGGDVNFAGCEVGSIELSGGRGPARLIFYESHVVHSISMVASRFGALEMVLCSVGEALNIQDCSFDAVFVRGARFGGSFEFNRNAVVGTVIVEDLKEVKSSFRGPVSFAGSKTGSQIIVRHSVFEQRLSFFAISATHLIIDDARVGDDLVVMGATLSISMRLSDLTVVGTLNAQGMAALTARLSDVEVGHVLKASYATFQTAELDRVETPSVEAMHLSVEGLLDLQTLRTWSCIDLTRARLGELAIAKSFDDVPSEFTFPADVMMRDCRYSSLRASWRSMVAAFDRQPHDSTAYRALEQYARVVGRPDLADAVYVAGRRHATETLPAGVKRASEAVLDWTSGYGAQPVKLLRAAALAFIVMVFAVLAYADINPKVFPANVASDVERLTRGIWVAFDVVVRGEKSSAIAPFAASSTAAPIVLVIDALLGLRLVILALVGLWSAYITGLVRYTNPIRS